MSLCKCTKLGGRQKSIASCQLQVLSHKFAIATSEVQCLHVALIVARLLHFPLSTFHVSTFNLRRSEQLTMRVKCDTRTHNDLHKPRRDNDARHCRGQTDRPDNLAACSLTHTPRASQVRSQVIDTISVARRNATDAAAAAQEHFATLLASTV